MTWMHWLALLLALGLFWMVGAYNRLVRLRSAVMRAFGALDTFFVRWIALTSECLAALDDLAPDGGMADAGAAVAAATTQLGASLAVARARPLDGGAIAALGAGVQALAGAWQTLTSYDGGGDATVQGELALWARQNESLRQQSVPARTAFNEAVASYNGAVVQFPASVLAWLFGFRQTHSL